MTKIRKLTDDQVAWVRAQRATRDRLVRQANSAATQSERDDCWRQINLMPTVDQQAEVLGVARITILRLRRGYAYVQPAPTSPNVPRGTSPNNHQQVSA